MWPWCVKMPTQNLLRLLLLLMLVMRIGLATVRCRFGSSGLVIRLDFCWTFSTIFGHDFEVEVWSVLMFGWGFKNLSLCQDSDDRFGEDFKFNFIRYADIFSIEICSRFVKIFWYELNSRVRCAFGNVVFKCGDSGETRCWNSDEFPHLAPHCLWCWNTSNFWMWRGVFTILFHTSYL